MDSFLVDVTKDYVWYFLTGFSGFVIGYVLVQISGFFILKYFLSAPLKIQIIIGVSSASSIAFFILPVLLFPEFYDLDYLIPFFSYTVPYFWVFLTGAIIAQRKICAKNLYLILTIIVLISINSFFVLSNLIKVTPFVQITSYYLSPLIAIMFFYLFVSQLKIKQSRSVNNFAKLMFGVYLVHTNPLSPIGLLIYGEHPIVLQYGPPFSYYLAWFFLCASVIFLSCAGVEFLRQLLFKKVKTLIHLKTP
jgi:hypothetical protein